MYQSITMDEFKALDKKYTLSLIDVREVNEFDGGHIEGARNMPLSQLQQISSQLNQKRPHYIICQAGGRSQKAAQYLSDSGFNVINVEGGMNAWDGKVVSLS